MRLVPTCPNVPGDHVCAVCESDCDSTTALKMRVRDLERENSELRWDLTETRRTLSTVIQAATNTRNLGDSGGAAAVLVNAEIARQAAAKPATDGYYRALPRRMADGWKDETGEGDDRPPVLGASTIRRYVKRFAEAELLDVEYRPGTIVRTVFDKRLGCEVQKDIPITEPWVRFKGSLADQLAPFAEYHNADRPNRGGVRPRQKVAVFPTTCPDCGGPVIAACGSCKTLVAPVEVEVTDESRDLLDRAAMARPTVFADGPSAESRALLDASSNATEDGGRRDGSGDQLERTTERVATPAPLAAVRAALATADRATDRDRSRHAKEDLGARLARIAIDKGRDPVPKSALVPLPNLATDLPLDQFDQWRGP